MSRSSARLAGMGDAFNLASSAPESIIAPEVERMATGSVKLASELFFEDYIRLEELVLNPDNEVFREIKKEDPRYWPQLKESIRKHGVLEAIHVTAPRQELGGKRLILAGESRFLICKELVAEGSTKHMKIKSQVAISDLEREVELSVLVASNNERFNVPVAIKAYLASVYIPAKLGKEPIIPTRRDLMEQYGVSEESAKRYVRIMRRALGLAEEEGVAPSPEHFSAASQELWSGETARRSGGSSSGESPSAASSVSLKQPKVPIESAPATAASAPPAHPAESSEPSSPGSSTPRAAVAPTATIGEYLKRLHDEPPAEIDTDEKREGFHFALRLIAEHQATIL